MVGLGKVQGFPLPGCAARPRPAVPCLQLPPFICFWCIVDSSATICVSACNGCYRLCWAPVQYFCVTVGSLTQTVRHNTFVILLFITLHTIFNDFFRQCTVHSVLSVVAASLAASPSGCCTPQFWCITT